MYPGRYARSSYYGFNPDPHYYGRFHSPPRFSPRYRDHSYPADRYDRREYDYRRESFSRYRDPTPVKRTRREPSRSRDKSPDSMSDSKSNLSRRRLNYSDENLSKSTDRISTYPRSKSPVVYSNDEQESDDDGWDEQDHIPHPSPDLYAQELPDFEKNEYYRRIELVYDALPDQLTKPEPKEDTNASLGRGSIQVKVRPESYPNSRFVKKQFLDYQSRYKSAIKTVNSKVTDDQGNVSIKKVKVVSKKKTKLGFEDDPFLPKWLYNISDREWNLTMEIDDDLYHALPRKVKPKDSFILQLKEVENIQKTCTVQLDTASHIDWMIAASKQMIQKLYDPETNAEQTLNDLTSLLTGIAYANEFTAGRTIYIHGGFTHLQRKTFIDQIEDINEPEERELLQQPFDVGAIFNGKLMDILKNISLRETTKAMKKLGSIENPFENRSRRRSPPPKQQSFPKYEQRSAKVGKQQYQDFDKNGRRFNSNNQSRGPKPWQQRSKNQPNNFLFPKGKPQRKWNKNRNDNRRDRSGR